MNSNRSMQQRLSARLATAALLALCSVVAAFAQTLAPKVNVIIERDAVRFDRQETGRLWQLEVFNPAGELLFASGFVNQPALAWALNGEQTGQTGQTGQTKAAEGLYAYTLKFLGENNEVAVTRRGHVIVNRAGAGDRVWVTSNDAVGAGAGASELTVTGAVAETLLGGARLADSLAPAPPRVASERAQTAPTRDATSEAPQNKTAAVLAVGPITGDGTANRIAKFTGANTIDDSVMTEAGGNIQVGTNSNLARLTAIHTNARGLYGRSDTAAGVWGQSISAQGVYGFSTNSAGVEGSSINAAGLSGVSSSNYGVYGTSASASFAGVFGVTAANNGKGLWGRAHNGADAVGVFGESNSGRGVFGDSDTGTGVRGESGSGSGVYGYSGSGRGVYGNSLNNHGVEGRSLSGEHAGVRGVTTHQEGVGVLGNAPGGSNQTSIGVYGHGGGWGVVGVGDAGHGVAGYGSFLGASIYGASGAAWAGYFDGDVVITGDVSAASLSGDFAAKMDHPLDPANKYLNQSFIESAERMNVQTGNITTDANGTATVTVPAYFAALGGDFRYQLTVVGQFAQAIVAQKLDGNSFTIRTDRPNVEVSWQVTGVRQDAAAARQPVEELKPAAERGFYLRPQLFNQPQEKGLEWARHAELMKRMNAPAKAKPQP